jgi:hypothetical protein
MTEAASTTAVGGSSARRRRRSRAGSRSRERQLNPVPKDTGRYATNRARRRGAQRELRCAPRAFPPNPKRANPQPAVGPWPDRAGLGPAGEWTNLIAGRSTVHGDAAVRQAARHKAESGPGRGQRVTLNGKICRRGGARTVSSKVAGVYLEVVGSSPEPGRWRRCSRNRWVSLTRWSSRSSLP